MAKKTDKKETKKKLTKKQEKDFREAKKIIEQLGGFVVSDSQSICYRHKGGAKALSSANFYDTSSNSIHRHALNNKIPYCKDCIKEMYYEYYNTSGNIKWSLYKTLEKIDVPFLQGTFDGAMKGAEDDYKGVLGQYMRLYNSFKNKNHWDYNFDNSDSIDVDFNDNGKLDLNIKTKSKMNNMEKRNKRDVINMLGYDPFEEYSPEDQRVLYSKLVPYLDDETIQDSYKVDCIIAIVLNLKKIDDINLIISKFFKDGNTILENSGEIKNLESVLKNLIENNNKMAAENGISVKNRRGKTNNLSTLTGKMKYFKEVGIDAIEQDYREMKYSIGMQRAANISIKAIKEQLNFNEDVQNEIIITQREMIEQLQKKVDDLNEENRKLNIEIDGGVTAITRENMGDLDG